MSSTTIHQVGDTVTVNKSNLSPWPRLSALSSFRKDMEDDFPNSDTVTGRVTAIDEITNEYVAHRGHVYYPDAVTRLSIQWTGVDSSGHFAEFHGGCVLADNTVPQEETQ